MKILITGVHGFVGSNLGNCSVNPAREQGDGYLFHRKTKSVIINS